MFDWLVDTVLEHFPIETKSEGKKIFIMGAKNSSPRTVQLDNDLPASVIEVSDAVVDRLKGVHSRGNSKRKW